MSSFFAQVRDVRITRDILRADLVDGRTITAPLAWYPTLLHASNRERRTWKTCAAGAGIHWPLLDYHLSVEGLLTGSPEAAGVSAKRDLMQPA